jgi:hypothetical protein
LLIQQLHIKQEVIDFEVHSNWPCESGNSPLALTQRSQSAVFDPFAEGPEDSIAEDKTP